MIRNLLAAIGFLRVVLAGAAGVYATRWHGDGRVARLAVGVGGLDLTSPEGQRLLDRRVEAAIDRVCQPDYSSFSSSRHEERECRRKARVGADWQIARAIDRAWERQRFAYDDTPMAPEEYDPTPVAPEEYDPAPIATRPAYAPPPAYVAPLGEPVLAEKHTTIIRKALKPRVKWVRTKHGLVKKTVHRKLVRTTVKKVYTRQTV